FQLGQQLLAQLAGLLDFLLMWHELLAHKVARGLDDHLLFFCEREIHGSFPLVFRPLTIPRQDGGLGRRSLRPTRGAVADAIAVARSASRPASHSGSPRHWRSDH